MRRIALVLMAATFVVVTVLATGSALAQDPEEEKKEAVEAKKQEGPEAPVAYPPPLHLVTTSSHQRVSRGLNAPRIGEYMQFSAYRFLRRLLRACANRLTTFYTWQFSERSSRRFIGC
jgi:hypothetical protein